jgi:hypothetical protein
MKGGPSSYCIAKAAGSIKVLPIYIGFSVEQPLIRYKIMLYERNYQSILKSTSYFKSSLQNKNTLKVLKGTLYLVDKCVLYFYLIIKKQINCYSINLLSNVVFSVLAY